MKNRLSETPRVTLPVALAATLPEAVTTLSEIVAAAPKAEIMQGPLPAPLAKATQTNATVISSGSTEASAGVVAAPPSAETPEDTPEATTAFVGSVNPRAWGWHNTPNYPWRDATTNPDEAMSDPSPTESTWTNRHLGDHRSTRQQGLGDLSRPNPPGSSPFKSDLVDGVKYNLWPMLIG